MDLKLVAQGVTNVSETYILFLDFSLVQYATFLSPSKYSWTWILSKYFWTFEQNSEIMYSSHK